MKVLSKLMDARLELQSTKLKKSGHNKFAGYNYFELGDFLPAIQNIFQKHKLCGIVSFKQDIATLTIYDIETSEKIEITSPMSTASLKGCHEVQNLGAVETYIRRYLWVTALEIVEHDIVDAAIQLAAPPKPVKRSGKSLEELEPLIRNCKTVTELQMVWAGLTADERATVAAIKDEIKGSLK